MSIKNFIPTIWSTKILQHMRDNLVYAGLVNRDYEGEITRRGSSVEVSMPGEVTIKDMPTRTHGDTKAIREIDAPEGMEVQKVTLLIDQEKYFNFGVDDVDKVQMNLDLMNSYTESASYGFQSTIEKHVAEIMAKEAKLVLGSDAQPVALTSENIYKQLIKMKVGLDKANVPPVGRFVVLPPEAEGLLLEDNKFVYVGTSSSEDSLKNGKVFRACGFDIAISNNVPVNENKYKIIATYKGSTTFAQQLLETKAYSPEKGFGDALKGLVVFGAKVVRPNKIVCMTATFDTSNAVVDKTKPSSSRTAAAKTK